MKNAFTLSEDGTTATIFLKRRSGEILHCLVDSADLPKLQTVNATWVSYWSSQVRRFYVGCAVKGGRRQTTLLMHRFLTDAQRDLEVDHINHDSLDNRRENLRVVTQSINGMNRRGANRVSQTGHRGISPHLGKFRLYLTVDGKQEYIGLFSTIEDALIARKQFPAYSNG